MTYLRIYNDVLTPQNEQRPLRVHRVRDIIKEQSVHGPIEVLYVRIPSVCHASR
jgi:hypothetical protein